MCAFHFGPWSRRFNVPQGTYFIADSMHRNEPKALKLLQGKQTSTQFQRFVPRFLTETVHKKDKSGFLRWWRYKNETFAFLIGQLFLWPIRGAMLEWCRVLSWMDSQKWFSHYHMGLLCLAGRNRFSRKWTQSTSFIEIRVMLQDK